MFWKFLNCTIMAGYNQWWIEWNNYNKILILQWFLIIFAIVIFGQKFIIANSILNNCYFKCDKFVKTWKSIKIHKNRQNKCVVP